MNPEEKKLLEETAELARENNKILHGMRRSNRWAMLFNLLYWFVILGGLAAGYYYTKPYIDLATKTYEQLKASSTAKNSSSSFPDIQKLLNGFNIPK